MGRRFAWGTPFVVLLLCLPFTTLAETLQEALFAAYKTNPELQAQRAKLRVTDETYVQTKAGLTPTVSLQTQGNYGREFLGKDTRRTQRLSDPNLPDYVEQNSVSTQLVISQPIYTGGRYAADVKAVDAQVRAGREALRTTEANILYNVIQTYDDTLRDQEQLEIRKLNLASLEQQVAETKARKKAGEVTRTDVAQAEAQLASEEALYRTAKGQLELSRVNLVAVTGEPAADLAPLPDLVGVPFTLDQALAAAERDNPDLGQALFEEKVSRAKIYAAKAGYSPTVSTQIQTGYQGSLVPYDSRDLNRATSVVLSVNVPLYSGGITRSQTRQAVDQNMADVMNSESIRRSVVKTLTTVWEERAVAQAALVTQATRVDAAKLAYEGMRREYTAGERSTLDVLVAEENLRDAELALSSARHDAYLYSAAILQNIGWLEIGNLMDTTELYRPEAHLKAVESAPVVPWQKPLQGLDLIAAKFSGLDEQH